VEIVEFHTNFEGLIREEGADVKPEILGVVVVKSEEGAVADIKPQMPPILDRVPVKTEKQTGVDVKPATFCGAAVKREEGQSPDFSYSPVNVKQEPVVKRNSNIDPFSYVQVQMKEEEEETEEERRIAESYY